MAHDDPRLFQTLCDLARAGARAGGAAAARYFGSPDLEIERKSDESPVTRADREAEQAIRALILEARPDDGWLGEETGEQAGRSGLVWIVDPVDGTKNFVRGHPTWTTLVACEAEGEPRRVVAAAVFQPMSGRLFDAFLGGGARADGVPIHVRPEARLAASRWPWYSEEWFERFGWGKLHAHLAAQGLLDGDHYDADGHVRVAEGLADVVVEPKLAVWDIAATSPIVTEAGGRFTDARGRADIRSGNAVLSNGLLHDEVLELVARLCALDTR